MRPAGIAVEILRTPGTTKTGKIPAPSASANADPPLGERKTVDVYQRGPPQHLHSEAKSSSGTGTPAAPAAAEAAQVEPREKKTPECLRDAPEIARRHRRLPVSLWSRKNLLVSVIRESVRFPLTRRRDSGAGQTSYTARFCDCSPITGQKRKRRPKKWTAITIGGM